MKYLRGKSLQRRKEMKWTVASALEAEGARVGNEVCCVRVGWTQRTMNNQNGARRADSCRWRTCVREGCASRGWQRKVCVAGRSISRTGWGEKRIWAAGVGGPVSPVDGSTFLQLRLAKFPRPGVHLEGWRCLDFSIPRAQLSESQGQGKSGGEDPRPVQV